MSEQAPEDHQEWAIAKVVETTEEAVVVAGFLNGSGIPAQVESLHVSELPVDLGGLGEVRVRVPREHLEAALAAIELREQGAPLADLEDLADDAPPPATDGK